MNYIVYVDVYFFVNSFMNGLLLWLLRKSDRKGNAPVRGSEVWRTALGAFVGGVLSCLIMMLFPEISFVTRFFLVNGILGYLMIWIAFDYKSVKQRLEAVVRLCLLEVIVSGILNMIINEKGFFSMVSGSYTAKTGNFVSMAAIGMFAAVVLGRVLRYYQREQYTRSHLYAVKLKYREKTCEGIGLLDTGNHLREPVSGMPVVIASRKAVEGLFGKELAVNIASLGKIEEPEMTCLMKWIPYHSLGKKNGWMPGVVIDEMTVWGEEGEEVSRKVLIGIVEEELSLEGQYQFILHEEYIGNRQ